MGEMDLEEEKGGRGARRILQMEQDDRKRREMLRQKKRRKRRIKAYMARAAFATLVFLLLFGLFLVVRRVGHRGNREGEAARTSFIERIFTKTPKKKIQNPPELDVELLTYNEYSRIGHALPEVKNVFVHYTANPGTTAMQNRNYFENLKDSHITSASAHFIIGIDGEIVQCIPLAEVAYAVAGRNYDSVSIECCHEGEDGKFSYATYQSLVHLAAWLISKYDLEVEDILRHYDSNGKLCPKYYVEHEDAWQQFHADVKAYIEAYGTTEPEEQESGTASN